MLPVHIFGYPADMPALERQARERGLWMVEDACEALGAVHADGTPVGARGNLAVFAFYPNKQMTTGEGGAVISPGPEAKVRIDSERNQGRAPDMGWLDHDRLGFNYRLDDLSCALGVAQLERLDDLLAERARVAALYGEALSGVEGLELPCPDAGGDRRSWFVYVVQLPPGVDRDAAVLALRERGVDSKPYLPAIHLIQLLPRALRSPRGRVPGLRGRGAPLARAAVLPRADRLRGRACRRRRACRRYGGGADLPIIREMSHRSRKEARTARLWGLVGFAGALRLPIALWHHAIGQMADDFHLELGYLLTGWSGYALIALGLAAAGPGGPVDGHAPRRAGSTRAPATPCSAGAPRSTSWARPWRASWAPPSVP